MIRSRAFVFLFLFVLLVYSLTFSTAATSFTVGEGFMKSLVLRTFLKSGQLGVDWGIMGVKGNFGKYYTQHEFGQNFFILPFFILFKTLRASGYPLYFSNAFFSALTSALLFKMLLSIGYGRTASCLTSLFYSLGTFAWFYAAKVPFEQPVAAFLLLGEFYFAIEYLKEPGKRFYLLISAAFFGFGVITKTELVLSIVPLAILLWTGFGMQARARKMLTAAAVFVAISIPFAVFSLFYNYVRFGGIFQTGYSAFMERTLFKPGYLPMGLAGFLFSPGKGIFFYCPVLILPLLAIRQFYRKAPRHVFRGATAAVLVYLIFYSFWVDWHGDFCWGPRYLLIITPFLIMPLASLFENWGRLSRAVKGLALAVLAASVLVQAAPAISNFYLGLAMKYGGNNLALAADRLGGEGSYGFWKSFFSLKESPLLNQFGILSDTARIALDKRNAFPVMLKLSSQWPPDVFIYIMKWFRYYRFDLWWTQAGTTTAYFWAAVIFTLALFCLYGLLTEIKKPAQP
ncbi:MAG: hypothetical protein M0018_00080 [Nitrospiraceae bacterium]|nr:hypothetical protein [Nitrospiraceae bacterium]